MADAAGANPESPFVVQVLGRVAVRNGGQDVQLQPGQRQLLALLVAAGSTGATADHLADEIWNDNLPANWQNSIRVAVSRLRKRTGLTIPSGGGRYRLGLGASEVDVWHLFQIVADDQAWRPDMEPLLSSTRIFPSVELTSSLQEAIGRIVASQRHLIERLPALGLRHSRPLLESLAAHLADDASDDQLTHAIAKIHYDSGASAAALGLIERCRRDRLEFFDAPVSSALELLEKQIRSQPLTVEPEEPARRTRSLPMQLERYRPERLVGRSTELDSLLASLGSSEPSATIVRGQAGAGKTALLAELAHRTDPSTYILFIAGSESSQLGLGPLTAAVLGFGEQVEEVNGLGLDPVGRMGVLATRLLNLIAAEAANRKILLMVDDAHWLDSPTCELLQYLVRSEMGAKIHGLLIAARAGRRKAPWTDLDRELSRLLPIAEMPLAPLSVQDVAELIANLQPKISLTARQQAAARLHQASAGLPEVARRILETGLTFTTPDISSAGVFDRLIDQVDEELRGVAVAAAVMGRSFRISKLSALTGRFEDSLFDMIDVLIHNNLVVETGSLDRFEFSHQLIVDAFLRSSSASKRARLHLRACDLTSDVHEISRHLVASGSLTDVEQKLDAVLASARAHLEKREFWESAAEFRVAIGLDDPQLGPRVFVDFARALSLSGSRRASLAVRKQAYALAVAADDSDLALAAACSGLPEAEVPDGEEDRFVQLEAIPTASLSQAGRLTQALTAARLAAQLGRPEQARRWAVAAAAVAGTGDELAEAALCERFVRTVDLAPKERLHKLTAAVEPLDLSPGLACRSSQFAAVDQLELGDTDEAASANAAFRSQALDLNDPLRQWHATVFDALLHETRGELTTATELADEAQRIGRRFGIAQAEIVRLAQEAFRLEALGRLGTLAEVISLIPGSDADSMLFKAATVRVLDAAGKADEALELAGALASGLLDRPSVTSHGCIAMLASTLGRHPSADLRRGAQEMLEPFREGAMVLGVGVGLLPSVDMLWTLLTDASERTRERALLRGIAACDTYGFTTWSVRYRLDLASLTGSKDLVTEARAMTDGTDLSILFDGAEQAA